MLNWFLGTVLAGVVMVPVGAVYLICLGGVYDGGVTLFGYVVVPAVVSFVFISFASILGLPLRLVPSWRKAWRARRGLSWLVAGVGLLAVVLSRVFATPGFAHDELGDAYESFTPQPLLLWLGILVLAFGLVHTWFSREPEPAWWIEGPR